MCKDQPVRCDTYIYAPKLCLASLHSKQASGKCWAYTCTLRSRSINAIAVQYSSTSTPTFNSNDHPHCGVWHGMPQGWIGGGGGGGGGLTQKINLKTELNSRCPNLVVVLRVSVALKKNFSHTKLYTVANMIYYLPSTFTPIRKEGVYFRIALFPKAKLDFVTKLSHIHGNITRTNQVTGNIIVSTCCLGDMAVNAPESEGAARGLRGIYSHITLTNMC